MVGAIWRAVVWGVVSILLVSFGGQVYADDPLDEAVYVRVNQVGYLDNDTKVAIAFSHQPVNGEFAAVDQATGSTVYTGELTPSSSQGWGTFPHFYKLDFSTVETPGRYFLRVVQTGDTSSTFRVGKDAYGT